MNRNKKNIAVEFSSIGEYHLHYHRIQNNELGSPKPFNCTVRNTQELLTECIELHPDEELHCTNYTDEVEPLLRYDENGFWAWLIPQQTWWPLRNENVKLALDKLGNARVKFYEGD